MRCGAAAGLLLLVLGVAGCAASAGLPPARVADVPWGESDADQVAFAARELAERGQARAAIERLEQVLAADPHHTDALRLRQDLLRERGRRGLLLHEARTAVARAPDDGTAHYLLGRIERDPAVKLAAFERAARLAPASLWPWLGLAHTVRGTDEERALRIYHDLFAASGQHPLVGIAWAATLREAGRLDAAAAVYAGMRGDARVRGVAELGLAQVALAKDDRRGAWSALLEALRRRPFDPGVQGLVLGWIEGGATDEQIAWFVDVLREDPLRLEQFGEGAGAYPLALLLQRSGQLQALRSLLERVVTARQPALRRFHRRLLLALGDVETFLALARAEVPLEVVDAEPNEVRGRWLALLRGPWHDGEALASPARAVDLLAALRDVGWLHEVELLAEVALRRWPAASSSLLALRDEARRELAFEAGVRRLIYTGYQENDLAPLAVVLARLRELSLRVLGHDVVGTPRTFSAPLVGEMIDPFTGALAAHFDRYNRYFVLGRRAGGVTEGLLMTRLSVQELPESAELALPARCFEVVAADRELRSRSGVLGGDLAGVALLNHFLIDHDAVREWAGGIAARRRVAAEDGDALLHDPLPAEPGDDPLDVAWRLELLSPVEDSELDAAVLDTIRHHERQHLVDAFWFLPVEQNLWRSLGLLFEFAFSPSAIEAEMERRAELASLAVSPHTELVLAHVAGFLDDPEARSPHHQGFAGLGRDLGTALAARGVASPATLPARWHLLPPDAVREAARALLGELQ